MSTGRDDFGIAIRSALLQKGAKQKFSLFFLISLSLIVFFLDNYPSKFMDRARSIFNDGIYRVSSVATSPINLISFLNSSFKKHVFTLNENKVLKEKLAELESQKFQNQFLLTENKNLKEIIETQTEKNYSTVISKIILDKDSPFLKSVIINKGSRSKIAKGMPVIESGYLVGRIVEVNYLSSRVLLLNDLNSRIPVVLEPSGTQAILTGRGKTKPSLLYLPDSYKTKDDSTVYTSGKDGILPSGIPVGNIFKEDNEFLVELFSNPSQLSFVNTILQNPKNMKEF
tara:strand:- start:5414 stop:6268 length:855 start_codon:yes stop_codon:yes gene_type:complete